MSWAYRTTWSQIFIAVGIGAMIEGAFDPLEGWLVVIIGAIAVAVGAAIEHSRYRLLALASAGMVAVGIAAMLELSHLGGIGGNSGNSLWWGLTIAPYPIGWILGLLVGVLAFIETVKRPSLRL